MYVFMCMCKNEDIAKKMVMVVLLLCIHRIIDNLCFPIFSKLTTINIYHFFKYEK